MRGGRVTTSWIEWFCNIEGHEIFALIDPEFIQDVFNLFGLKAKFPDFDRAIKSILGDFPSREEFKAPGFRQFFAQCVDLYGLIHARFILTPRGLHLMAEKYANQVFGTCPRVLCRNQPVFPVGLSDVLGQHRLRVYCPCCQEIYLPMTVKSDDHPFDSLDEYDDDDRLSLSSLERNVRSRDKINESSASTILANMDGAFYGPSFPHIFLFHLPTLIPGAIPRPYVPKVAGFRVKGKKSIIQIKIDNGEYGEYAKEQAGSHRQRYYQPLQNDQEGDSGSQQ